jgi:hypothetical protein
MLSISEISVLERLVRDQESLIQQFGARFGPDSDWLSHQSSKLTQLRERLETSLASPCQLMGVGVDGGSASLVITATSTVHAGPKSFHIRAVKSIRRPSARSIEIAVAGREMAIFSHNITSENEQLVDTLEGVLGAHLKRYNHARVRTAGRLVALRKRRFVAYTDEEKEVELLALWSLMVPKEALPARRCKEWGRIGFQGKDPATDFRGMGVLGLELLTYLARTQQETVVQMVEFAGDPDNKHEYPLAITGINMGHMLFEMLNLTPPGGEAAPLPPAHEPAWDTPLFHLLVANAGKGASFEEVFCLAMISFHLLWVRWRATYTDFPHVLKEHRMRIEKSLADEPDWETFKSRILNSE